jgi:hypothetical protein
VQLEGNNTITLNRTTINKAVQYWLNEEVLQDNTEVVSVSFDGQAGVFNVIVKGTEATECKPR